MIFSEYFIFVILHIIPLGVDMSGYGGGYGRRKRHRGREMGYGVQNEYWHGYGGGPPWAGRGRGKWNTESYGITPPPITRSGDQSAVRIVATTLDSNGLDSRISHMFARAPYIIVVDIVNGVVSRMDSIQNPFIQIPRGAGRSFTQWILSIGANTVIASNIGMHMLEMLQRSGVKVHIVSPGTRLIDALKSLRYLK